MVAQETTSHISLWGKLEPLGSSRTLQGLPGTVVRLPRAKLMLGGGFGPYPSPEGPPFRIFLFPPSGPGLTSRSSTDTNSFSTASMAVGLAILTTQTLLCHSLHGPLTGAESHFRRPAEVRPPPLSRTNRFTWPTPSPPFSRLVGGVTDAHAPTGLAGAGCVLKTVFEGTLRAPQNTEVASIKSETTSW